MPEKNEIDYCIEILRAKADFLRSRYYFETAKDLDDVVARLRKMNESGRKKRSLKAHG